MKAIIRLYRKFIGITLIPRKMLGDSKGYYVLASMHPRKSITWLWAIYYDKRERAGKRVYIKTQKPMWK